MVMLSVNRFGEISPLWQKFTSFGQFFDGLFLIWQICDIFGLIFIVANGQILKDNIMLHLNVLMTSAPARELE